MKSMELKETSPFGVTYCPPALQMYLCLCPLPWGAYPDYSLVNFLSVNVQLFFHRNCVRISHQGTSVYFCCRCNYRPVWSMHELFYPNKDCCHRLYLWKSRRLCERLPERRQHAYMGSFGVSCLFPWQPWRVRSQRCFSRGPSGTCLECLPHMG